MISAAVIEALKEIVPADKILLQEPMKLHTTFRIGGPADCLIYLENEEQLSRIRKYLHLVDVPYTVIGNGSNLLVSDNGYAGIILVIGRYMSKIEVKDCCLEAEAGALMSQVAKAAKEHGLTGLEFAAGIPGTIGGGAVMNAGAYGGEMSQVVTMVTVVNRSGEIMELDNSTMEYGYRTSVIQNQPFVVTKVTFRLQPGDPEQIAARMEELAYLKIPPREQEENKLLLLRGERLYEESLGDERKIIEHALQRFEMALNTQDPVKIETGRNEFREFLEEWDQES